MPKRWRRFAVKTASYVKHSKPSNERACGPASALPVIVVGVVLGGLADDASGFPMWFWSLGLVLVSGYAIRRCWVIWRDR